MNLTDMIAEVKTRCGIASAVTTFDNRIISAMNTKQRTLCNDELLPILEAEATVYTVASSDTSDFPANIYPHRLYGKPYQLTTPSELDRLTDIEFRKNYLANRNESGNPLRFRTFATTRATRRHVFKWHPIPSSRIAIYLPYYEYFRTLCKVHAISGDLVDVADAYDLTTSVALANDIKTTYTAHIANTDAHLAADATNTVAAANATDLATAITLANEIKADFNAHRSQAGVHTESDTKNQVTSANATTQGTLNTLLNEMKEDFNEHVLRAQENDLTNLYPDVLVLAGHLAIIRHYPEYGDYSAVKAEYEDAYEAMLQDVTRQPGKRGIVGGQATGARSVIRRPGGYFPATISES